MNTLEPMRIKSRLRRLEGQAIPPAEPAPFAIEQDAPGATVRFVRDGEPVELSPEVYRLRYVEPYPGVSPLTWSDQPWTADLYRNPK
jgi:hypothetical protein